MIQPLWTLNSLVDDLRRLGIAPGDAVMVHASLRAVGPTERGAVGLIQALERAVGQDGTLLMLLSAQSDWEDQPEHERQRLLETSESFDPQRTPAHPDMGSLAEVFRTLPGTLVNDHPAARFGARGRQAAYLLGGTPWHDYYGPGSPLERFLMLGGRVLRLGADLNTVTLIHHAEYLVALPQKRTVRRYYRVLGEHGPETRACDGLDDSGGIVETEGDYFQTLLEAYLRAGYGRTGQVGSARSELLEARHLVDYSVAWMDTHLRSGSPSNEMHGLPAK